MFFLLTRGRCSNFRAGKYRNQKRMWLILTEWLKWFSNSFRNWRLAKPGIVACGGIGFLHMPQQCARGLLSKVVTWPRLTVSQETFHTALCYGVARYVECYYMLVAPAFLLDLHNCTHQQPQPNSLPEIAFCQPNIGLFSFEMPFLLSLKCEILTIKHKSKTLSALSKYVSQAATRSCVWMDYVWLNLH